MRRILAENADTAFGQAHGFAYISTADQFRQTVPVQTYESLRDLIERQELTGEPCLTQEQPVFYNRTSGTVAAPKDIPITKSALARIKGLQRLTAYVMATKTSMLTGKVFSITGAAVEGTMPGGTPFGSASGLLNANQSRLIRRRYVLPTELSDIADNDARYLLTGILAAADQSVTCLATANPSTLVRLMDVINQNADLVTEAVAEGRPPVGLDVGPLNTDSLLQPQPERAEELEQSRNAAGGLTYADLWPGLSGLLTLEQLQEGRDYYVIVTTASGLYRYDMSDIVRVTGFVEATPTLVFVQKGKGITSITGEKLHEGQAINAVISALDQRGLTPDFFIMLADVDRAVYTLYLEAATGAAGPPGSPGLAGDIDDRLCDLNIEYKSKRASRRLTQLAVKSVLPGTGDAFRRRRVAEGQRDVQFKFVHLQYRHECNFDFEERVASAGETA